MQHPMVRGSSWARGVIAVGLICSLSGCSKDGSSGLGTSTAMAGTGSAGQSPGALGSGASDMTNGAGPGQLPLPMVPPLSWQPCPDEDHLGLECSTIQVPLNYQQPSGPQITLALTRKLHTQAPYLGVILGNPGGPGNPGRDMAFWGEELPLDLVQGYDWVGIDPRGTGLSQPSLACTGQNSQLRHLPYVPQNPAQADQMRATYQQIAQHCASAPGHELLPFMTTQDWARDTELVRRALGVERVTFWGASYGSYLGLVYAGMFPERVEKMLLDGVVHPAQGWQAYHKAQPGAWVQSVDLFYAWLAEQHDLFGLGTSSQEVAASVQAKLAQLRARPPGQPGTTHPGRALTDALNLSAYGVQYWDVVGRVLSEVIVRGNERFLESSVDPSSDNAYSVYLAMVCSEQSWQAWPELAAATQASQAGAGSYFGWSNAWLTSACSGWPIVARPQAPVQPARLTMPVLMMGETFDGTSPLSVALQLRGQLPNAALVEGQGSSHASSLFGSECMLAAIESFLRTGALPPKQPGNVADLRCEAALPLF